MASAEHADHLEWRQTTVDGRAAFYGEAGEGLTVLFLHGWALDQKSYKRALKRLVRLGCRVVAPALPGFGGTPNLPLPPSFAAYAGWVARFLDALGVDQPAYVVGHSFGGGVAIKLAHDHPDRVAFLVLVNSVGGTTWSLSNLTRTIRSRPPWTWLRHPPADMLPLGYLWRVVPIILDDAVPNVIRNPLGVLGVLHLLHRADLVAELEELKRRQLAVVVLWGDHDTVIPKASFDALCRAIGSQGAVIEGRHSWLLADPDAFGSILTNSIEVARLGRQLEDEDEAGNLRRACTSAQNSGSVTSTTDPRIPSDTASWHIR